MPPRRVKMAPAKGDPAVEEELQLAWRRQGVRAVVALATYYVPILLLLALSVWHDADMLSPGFAHMYALSGVADVATGLWVGGWDAGPRCIWLAASTAYFYALGPVLPAAANGVVLGLALSFGTVMGGVVAYDNALAWFLQDPTGATL